MPFLIKKMLRLNKTKFKGLILLMWTNKNSFVARIHIAHPQGVNNHSLLLMKRKRKKMF